MEGHRDPRRRWPTSRSRIALWSAAFCVLLAPAVAMQFTDEVAWGPGDFAAMAALLVAACGAFECVARATGSIVHRTVLGTAIFAVFIAVWAHLAVGIF